MLFNQFLLLLTEMSVITIIAIVNENEKKNEFINKTKTNTIHNSFNVIIFLARKGKRFVCFVCMWRHQVVFFMPIYASRWLITTQKEQLCTR